MRRQFRDVRHVLLDIEGTICPIAFTKDTLFPYALNSLSSVLQAQWSAPEFQGYRSTFPKSAQASPEAFEAHARELTEQNAKIGYFKDLQGGYLWEDGYKNSAYTSPFFPDVRPALEKWRSSNMNISIYSAGSVFAQKLLFEYVNSNDPENPKATVDLRNLVSEWFDTSNAGPKTERESYLKIVKTLKEEPGRVLFFSDNLVELMTAEQVGIRVVLLDRPGNPELQLSEEAQKRVDVMMSFDEVEFPMESEKGEVEAADDGHQRRKQDVPDEEDQQGTNGAQDQSTYGAHERLGPHEETREGSNEDNQPARKKQKTSRSKVRRSKAKSEDSTPRRRSQRLQESKT